MHCFITYAYTVMHYCYIHLGLTFYCEALQPICIELYTKLCLISGIL